MQLSSYKIKQEESGYMFLLRSIEERHVTFDGYKILVSCTVIEENTLSYLSIGVFHLLYTRRCKF